MEENDEKVEREEKVEHEEKNDAWFTTRASLFVIHFIDDLIEKYRDKIGTYSQVIRTLYEEQVDWKCILIFAQTPECIHSLWEIIVKDGSEMPNDFHDMIVNYVQTNYDESSPELFYSYYDSVNVPVPGPVPGPVPDPGEEFQVLPEFLEQMQNIRRDQTPPAA